MKNLIAILSTPQTHPQASLLAERLTLPCISDQDKTWQSAYDFLLVMTPAYLGIIKSSAQRFSPFYIDFCSAKLRFRSKQLGFSRELLARAIGIRPQDHPTIIDATAGFGRDSFILAMLGYEVIMLERSPIIHALLNDGLNRARDSNLEPIIKRMHLIQTDAIPWLQTCCIKKPAVIYLDPMFPTKKKSASPRKEMALLQDLLGNDTDDEMLLNTALACATRRVVIKRPRLASCPKNRSPSFTFKGKSSRFDIFIV